MEKPKQEHFFLGADCRIDEAAAVGVVSLRPVDERTLVIGDGARCLRGSCIYEGTRIGRGLIIGHNAVIREENVIGDDFRLWNNSMIDYGCRIGNGVKIHCNCYIAQFSVIEDEVFCAPGVVFGNDPHPGCLNSQECLKGPVLKKGAQIGCNATILPGITIGEYAMVGAGSVVTRDVAARTVVCGNPARVLKSTDQIACPRYPERGYRRKTD